MPASRQRHSNTDRQPGKTLWSGVLVIALALLSLTASSCVNCCPDERTTPPPESAFVKTSLTGSSKNPTYLTWRTKSPGTPVLLLHALNGISPSVLHWALEMESWGYRVYIPSLYGDPIKGESAYGYDDGIAAARFLTKMPEWDLKSTEHPGPIVEEVRAFSRNVSAREGNRDIAVIGNCLTGILPLTVLDEPHVRLAVLAQPALPVLKLHQVLFRLPQSRRKQEALPFSNAHLAPVLDSMRSDPDKHIIGFHYAHDPVAPIVKFDRLHDALSETGLDNRFTAFVLEKPDSTYTAERSHWVTGGTTEERRKMLTPHSTLSNPEVREDRDWFRAQLRNELGRVMLR